MRAEIIRNILAAGLLVSCLAAIAPARAAGPPADYKLDADHTETSPDKSTTVEQYKFVTKDDDWKWQFWARHGDTFTMLAPEQDDYAAGFRFTPDSQWLVRMQKTGSGEATMYLYHLTEKGFVTATKKSIADLAWDYFNSRPESKKVPKPDFHIFAGLVEGTENNYKDLGVKWPPNRYLVIGLGGDADSRRRGQLLVIRGWYCRYDLTTGKFDVPAEFAKNNREALDPKRQKGD